MDDPKHLKLGDPCPSCGGELAPARVPTEDERRRFEDRELRQPLPAGSDTMSAQGRAEHGALYSCSSCGYATRFPIADGEADAEPNGKTERAAAGGGRRR